MTPVFVPSVWNLKIPPRVHIFLWLLSKNKLLTRDNLAKRQNLDTETCLFCNEHETSQHLFFECVVAGTIWDLISQALGTDLRSFTAVASKWLSNKKFAAINIVSSAVLWSLRKLRNDICFQNTAWRDLRLLLWKVVKLMQNWQILCPPLLLEDLQSYITIIREMARSPARLMNGTS